MQTKRQYSLWRVNVSFISIYLSVSWDLLEPLTAPSGPFTTRTTAAFTLHSFFSSSLRLWYFSSFPCSIFLVLLGTWYSYINHYSCLPLLVQHNSVQLVSHQQFVCLYLEGPQDLISVIPF